MYYVDYFCRINYTNVILLGFDSNTENNQFIALMNYIFSPRPVPANPTSWTKNTPQKIAINR